jgi:uncharacterized protein (TIGR03437 family)
MVVLQTRYEVRIGEPIEVPVAADTRDFMVRAKTRRVTASGQDVAGLVMAPNETQDKILLAPNSKATPGEYTVTLSATSAAGEEMDADVVVVVKPRQAVPLGNTRPPVVLLNGWIAGYSGTCTISSSSTVTFGNLAQYLVSDGAPIVYLFDNCAEDANQPIETLGGDLNAFLNSIKYTDGTQVTQIDLVAHSIGGLIARAYLEGLQTNETYLPPYSPLVDHLVMIAVPNFGSFLVGNYATEFAVGSQGGELIPGSSLLWNLATWNERGDDLAGVSAIAIVGNAGSYATTTSANALLNASDGLVSTTSAALGFVAENTNATATRIVPYCQVDPSVFTTVALGTFNCNAAGIANVTSTSQETGLIVRSYLSGTTAWQSVGTAPSSDEWLATNGGAFFAMQNLTAGYVTDLSTVDWGNVALMDGGDLQTTIYYTDFVTGGAASKFVATSASLGTFNCGSLAVQAGSFAAFRCKLNLAISCPPGSTTCTGAVTPLSTAVTGRAVTSGSAIILAGEDFGSQCSSCKVYATPAGATSPTTLTVNSWTSTAISVQLPSSLTGYQTLQVNGTSGVDSIGVRVIAAVAGPVLSLNFTSLQFAYTAGGNVPAAQPFTITNSGVGTLTWTAAVSSTAAWLNIDSTSGTAPSTVNASINPASLSVGTYQGSITITAAGASNTSATVSVTLVVTAGSAALSVSPAALSFAAAVGGTAPAAQPFTIANSATGTLTWTAAVSSTATWLSIDSTSGTAPSTVNVSVNPASLSAGTYQGTITITAAGASNSPATVTVTLVTAAPGVLSVSPASLSFQYTAGGAVPAAQTISIANTGGGTFNWVAVSSVYWAALSATSGSIPGTLAISVLPQNLAAGTYNATVTVGATDKSVTPVSVNVNLTVAGTPPTPAITGVANAAGFESNIAAATWVSIFGTNLSQITYAWQASDLFNGALPTSLEGVSVSIDGIPAYIAYVSPTQINVLAPDDTNLGSVPVVVTIAGHASNSFAVQKNQFSPAFLTFNGAYVAAVHLNYTLLGPPGLIAGATFTPATPGETIALYGVGFGPTNPPQPTGQEPTTAPPLASSFTMTIGGIAVTPSFAGLSGSGLYQFNVTVPASLANGDAAVSATIGGVTTQAGVLLSVQQ